MRQRITFFAGIVLLILVTSGLLYHLYGFLSNNAAVSMWKLSSNIQYGFQMDSHNIPLNRTSSTSKRIGVVMAIHQDTPLYRASVENHRRYCQMHGYRFMTQSNNLLPEAPFPQPKGNEYQKMAVLMQAVIIGLDSNEFDWILWSDLDTFIVNPSIPLESLLPPTPSAYSEEHAPYFLGNQDHNGFNAGSFFIKVERWSVQLLAMAMADPYNQHKSESSNSSGHTPPSLNDQASLGRIFQSFPLFGQHFHEIPYGWANLYPPQDLDGNLDTSIPHIIPANVEKWVSSMETAAGLQQRHRRAPTSTTGPPPLNQKTLSHLRTLLDLPSTFLPPEFQGSLQVHLVNFRKYQFYYNSLLVINAKFVQIGLAALVVRFHERLASEENLNPVELWVNERDSTLWGLKHAQPEGLNDRQQKWYTTRKSGIDGMRWLD